MTGATSSGTGDDPADFRSAEDWLAERGIPRRRIRVEAAAAPDEPLTSDGAASDAVAIPTGPSTRQVVQLATEAPPTVPGTGVDPAAPGAQPNVQPEVEPDARARPEVGDEVSRALAFIQRSTGTTPASTRRLERKLADRDVPAAAIRIALSDATAQGLVDDRAMAAALVAEGRAKGHAPRRLRMDLRKRELPDDVIDTALASLGDRDPEAVAFDVAARKAIELRGVDAETAFRRLVGFLARRGHAPGIARKVARQVLFDDREDDRLTGH